MDREETDAYVATRRLKRLKRAAAPSKARLIASYETAAEDVGGDAAGATDSEDDGDEDGCEGEGESWSEDEDEEKGERRGKKRTGRLGCSGGGSGSGGLQDCQLRTTWAVGALGTHDQQARNFSCGSAVRAPAAVAAAAATTLHVSNDGRILRALGEGEAAASAVAEAKQENAMAPP